ncbi:MAG: carbohydrate ABC transporter permease [Anaerolineae bacterium]
MAVRSLERSAVRASPTKRTFRDILLGKRVRRYVDHGLSHLVLLATGLAFFLPFYWLVSTSVKPNNELFLLPPKWIPSRLVWENFPRAWNYLPFATYFKNTIYICVFNVVATIVSCTLTAYGFSRIRWPGRDSLFIVLIATMMIPYQVTLVPTFLIFKWIGWVGTFNPLTWPAFTGSAFYIFLLRQFYMTIPLELSEAAKMDGAGELRTFLQIMVPLTRPAMATVALFTFLANWTDFLGPLIYLSRQEQFTISLGLRGFLTRFGAQWELLMAGTTITVVPIVVLFFLTQRTFIQGITLTGIKG